MTLQLCSLLIQRGQRGGQAETTFLMRGWTPAAGELRVNPTPIPVPMAATNAHRPHSSALLLLLGQDAVVGSDKDYSDPTGL